MNRGIKVLQTLALPLGYGTVCLNIMNVQAVFVKIKNTLLIYARTNIISNGMRRIVTVYKWEISKIFDNWRKALAVILLPAIIMMLALNVFPMLINYMSTGSLNQRPIYVVNAPRSFESYLDSIDGTTVYRFNFVDLDDFIADYFETERYDEMVKNGDIFLFFSSDLEDEDFDREVSEFYEQLSAGNTEVKSEAVIYIGYNGELVTVENKVLQFEDTILENYRDYARDYLGSDYSNIGVEYFTVDDFNPVTKTLDYRPSANEGAARVISGVLALLMYYCTYSLSCDMFASERDRGFFTKLLMAPVKPSEIIKGKYLAIISIVSVSAVVTFFFLFMSSWLNRSNDAMSLLPFGMLLTPSQLLYLLLILPATAFAMVSLTFNIIFALTKMDEIITNLQFPLVLFLFDFFITMFRWQRPVWLEYLIPMHNTIAVTRDIFMSQHSLTRISISILVNLLAGLIIYRKTCKKEGFT